MKYVRPLINSTDSGRTGPVQAVALAVVCLAPLAARPYAVTPTSKIPPFFNASTRWLPSGRTVLVLERRDQLGGACTIEEPFAEPGW